MKQRTFLSPRVRHTTKNIASVKEYKTRRSCAMVRLPPLISTPRIPTQYNSKVSEMYLEKLKDTLNTLQETRRIKKEKIKSAKSIGFTYNVRFSTKEIQNFGLETLERKAKKIYRKRKQHEACEIIQSWWRKLMSKRRNKIAEESTRKAASVIQKYWKSYLLRKKARERLQSLRKNRSVFKRLFVKVLANCELTELREEKTLQNHFKYFDDLKNQLMRECVRVIWRNFKAYMFKKKLRNKRFQNKISLTPNRFRNPNIAMIVKQRGMALNIETGNLWKDTGSSISKSAVPQTKTKVRNKKQMKFFKVKTQHQRHSYLGSVNE